MKLKSSLITPCKIAYKIELSNDTNFIAICYNKNKELNCYLNLNIY